MHRLIFIPLLLISFHYAEKKEIGVVPIKQEQLRQLIQNRNGKALFVNVWATWCKPCVEEFPDIIKLAEEYQQNGSAIEFIAVSADYPDEVDSLIIPFLKKFPSVPFKIYVADFESQDEFISAFDSSWSGAIPATFIYNDAGKKQQFLTGQHSYQQFKEEIEKVLHIH
jgi:thiol-disulfide isomerase/thioredoxin